MRRVRRIYAVTVIGLIAIYFTVSSLRVTAVVMIGLASAATIWGVSATVRPARDIAWRLISAGVLIVTIGQAAFNVLATSGHADAFPSIPDGVYLCAYPPLAAGLLWLGMPSSPARDRSAWIDTIALSLAGSLLVWIWLIRPTLESMVLTGGGKVVLVAGWVGDVVILVAAARLALVWRGNRATTLLTLGAFALFLADVRYGTDLLAMVWRSGGQVDGGIIAFYTLSGTAVLDSSISGIGGGPANERRFNASSLITITVALLIGPTVLLMEAASGTVTTPVAIAVVMVLIGLLVVVRLGIALSRHRRSAGQESVQRATTRRLGLAMSAADVTSALDAALETMAHRSRTSATVIADGRPGALADDILRVRVDAQNGEARTVAYRADPTDLAELASRLTGLAEVAGVALDRIDLAAQVRVIEREQDLLAYRAAHDALTGLVNAEQFRLGLRQASRKPVPDRLAAVMFLDLDNFKPVNDTFGHEIGDRVLIETARRIRACLRGDDVAARLGGDEFAVLIRGVSDQKAAKAVARRLTKVLGQAMTIDGIQLLCPASIGLALAATATEYDTLLRRADAALYAAKSAGGGLWRAQQPDMPSPVRRAGTLGQELYRALDPDSSRSDGGPTLFYQPIMELATNVLAGFEALLRWQHPTYGAVDAAELVALAERTGLILSLGDHVLTTALADAHRLPLGSGYLSVNVSVSQLLLPTVTARLRQHIIDADFDPTRLVIEVTESQPIDDGDPVWDQLHRLREMGVRIAIDDYGAGYASLSHLRRPVIDIVKLDQRFATDLHQDRDRRLVKAVVDLAADLDLLLVAEGIQDEATRKTLIELGCPMGQGYLYAAAMPLDQAARWRPPSR